MEYEVSLEDEVSIYVNIYMCFVNTFIWQHILQVRDLRRTVEGMDRRLKAKHHLLTEMMKGGARVSVSNMFS